MYLINIGQIGASIASGSGFFMTDAANEQLNLSAKI
jgi:hypothetical protein